MFERVATLRSPMQRKLSFPISPDLRGYLRRYKREHDLPVTYERLRAFHEVIPLTDHHISWREATPLRDCPRQRDGMRRRP